MEAVDRQIACSHEKYYNPEICKMFGGETENMKDFKVEECVFNRVDDDKKVSECGNLYKSFCSKLDFNEEEKGNRDSNETCFCEPRKESLLKTFAGPKRNLLCKCYKNSKENSSNLIKPKTYTKYCVRVGNDDNAPRYICDLTKQRVTLDALQPCKDPKPLSHEELMQRAIEMLSYRDDILKSKDSESLDHEDIMQKVSEILSHQEDILEALNNGYVLPNNLLDVFNEKKIRRRRADAGPHSTTVTPVSNETAGVSSSSLPASPGSGGPSTSTATVTVLTSSKPPSVPPTTSISPNATTASSNTTSGGQKSSVSPGLSTTLPTPTRSTSAHSTTGSATTPAATTPKHASSSSVTESTTTTLSATTTAHSSSSSSSTPGLSSSMSSMSALGISTSSGNPNETLHSNSSSSAVSFQIGNIFGQHTRTVSMFGLPLLGVMVLAVLGIMAFRKKKNKGNKGKIIG